MNFLSFALLIFSLSHQSLAANASVEQKIDPPVVQSREDHFMSLKVADIPVGLIVDFPKNPQILLDSTQSFTLGNCVLKNSATVPDNSAGKPRTILGPKIVSITQTFPIRFGSGPLVKTTIFFANSKSRIVCPPETSLNDLSKELNRHGIIIVFPDPADSLELSSPVAVKTDAAT